jgi:hypothetical protein
MTSLLFNGDNERRRPLQAERHSLSARILALHTPIGLPVSPLDLND